VSRTGVALLLAASLASGAPDALKAWRTEVKRAHAAEKSFWRDFRTAFNDALQTFTAPLEAADAQPDQNKEATYDLSAFRRLYDDFERIQAELAKVDEAFGASGHPKAAATLVDALLDLAKRVEALEKELDDGRPKFRYYVFDPALGVERHGLAARRRGLVAGLAKCDAAGLAAAWKKAAAADRRSSYRRVAVVDAWALAGAREALQPLVAAEEPLTVRLAAMEGLVGCGADARPALIALLDDESPLMRRALLQEVRARAAKDPHWILPLAERVGKAEGSLRDEYVATLAALTQQRFGWAPDRWRTWAESKREDIEDGVFAENLKVEEAEPAAVPGSFRFYGVPCASLGVAFVVNGGQHMLVPADWEVQRTHFRDYWRGMRKTWEETTPSHLAVVLDQFDRAAAAFPDTLAFDVISLQGIFTFKRLAEKKPLSKRTRDIEAARKLLEQASARGWCSQYVGLRAAGELAAVDTVYLVDPGEIRGGRFLTPEAVVAAFARYNRFRRLVVHAIRISNEKEEAETLMKGLASVSGGTYVWQSKPP